MADNFRVALLGNPNAGKSALFNKLTGARQKIANYPGVTVERVAGVLALPDVIDQVGLPTELMPYLDLQERRQLMGGTASEFLRFTPPPIT